MEYRIIKDYKGNESYRKSFNELAKLVFGIDFERWYSLGFWNERYVCFSILDGERVVSNVSANIMDLIIDGAVVPVIQIGTVMTHPDYRKKGLAARLMDTVLKEYKHKCDIVFLFANPDAAGFYRKFGFDTVYETGFYAEAPDKPGYTKKGGKPENADESLSLLTKMPAGSRKLNLSNSADVELIRRLSAARAPLSLAFGTAGTEGILAWHCLNSLPEAIYYLEALDTIVICRKENGVLHLYDVISRNTPDYRELIGELWLEGEPEEIAFHFTPNMESIPVKCRPYDTNEYIFFTMSQKIHLEGAFFYPYTAHA
ncbi:MAG TPA: GNAT family N-acetyltransferase [Clostridia bacterium]|nr:GNAT family N-acetyltransferase [Clostridia bacterium]